MWISAYHGCGVAERTRSRSMIHLLLQMAGVERTSGPGAEAERTMETLAFEKWVSGWMIACVGSQATEGTWPEPELFKRNEAKGPYTVESAGGVHPIKRLYEMLDIVEAHLNERTTLEKIT